MNTDILATDGTFTYGFDRNGNLTRRTDLSDPEQDSYWSYSYDPDNKLRQAVRVENGSTTKTITYWYDPMGNLVERSCTIGSQTTTTDYTVDIAQGLPVVLIEQRSGGETLLYTYGEDLLKVSKNGDYYYFYDGLGSTRTITSGTAGTVVAEYLYDAYGAQLLTGQPTWNTRLFTGEPFDPDTGLIYLRARWYDPGTGRFVSRDTYEGSPGKPLSQHRYAYCSSNPVNASDPTGHGENTISLATSMAIFAGFCATHYSAILNVADFVVGFVGGDAIPPGFEIVPGGLQPATGAVTREIAEDAVKATIKRMESKGAKLIYQSENLYRNGIDTLFRLGDKIIHREVKCVRAPKGGAKSYLRRYPKSLNRRQCSGSWTKEHVKALESGKKLTTAEADEIIQQLSQNPELREGLEEYVDVWVYCHLRAGSLCSKGERSVLQA